MAATLAVVTYVHRRVVLFEGFAVCLGRVSTLLLFENKLVGKV